MKHAILFALLIPSLSSIAEMLPMPTPGSAGSLAPPVSTTPSMLPTIDSMKQAAYLMFQSALKARIASLLRDADLQDQLIRQADEYLRQVAPYASAVEMDYFYRSIELMKGRAVKMREAAQTLSGYLGQSASDLDETGLGGLNSGYQDTSIIGFGGLGLSAASAGP